MEPSTSFSGHRRRLSYPGRPRRFSSLTLSLAASVPSVTLTFLAESVLSVARRPQWPWRPCLPVMLMPSLAQWPVPPLASWAVPRPCIGPRQQGCARLIFFRADSTLTRMTIQVIQLRLNSNPKFANLTQLWLNSKSKFTNLTQLWLNSFESELSQIWLMTHHILPDLAKSCWPEGGGGRSNVAAGLCKVTDKCKISTFSLQKNQWLNVDSSSIQLTQLWLKWRSAWFDSDSTHILDFHSRLDSDSTHLSQSRVKFDSRLMSRAQPCSAAPAPSVVMVSSPGLQRPGALSALGAP